MSCAFGYSQSINFDQLGKEKWLRYNGGVAANAVYYDGTANRQNLTYYLTGNLNFNIAGLYNIPLSFTYSNQDFNFPNPFNFNRLSLHPSYKWATAHLGDVSMSFSPYTLSGHQFTGAGFDIAPKGKFIISGMYGRFLRATEYNLEEPQALTAYKRIGYGLKTTYDFDFAKLGVILFKANDDENSLENPFPVELGLAPKDNAVLSFESEFQLFNKARIHAEYAISGVTEDTRLANARGRNGLLSFILDENISTNYYNALNLSFDYPAGNGSLGVGYERIDPEYKTLGAYYFNNDFENIIINASQSIFNNKVNVSVNAGLQKDNLDDSKETYQQRVVSSVNVNYTASDRMGINGSYSNFQSFTNIRDQFDYINQVGDLDNIDTLNYRQISQNANLGINYILKKTKAKQHSTNLNLVYQNSNNQQNGETVEGGKNSFYNGTAGYTLGYPEKTLSISLAGNTSYNTAGENKNLTLGPTLSVSKQFFDKQLRTNLSSSYNTSFANGEQQNNVYNFRLGSNYLYLERHNLSLNFLLLFRNLKTNNSNDLTITFGYSYAFDNFKLHLKGGNRKERDPRTKENTLSFRYRNVSYSGTIPELNQQLTTVFNSSKFSDTPLFKKDELTVLLATTKEQKGNNAYKDAALLFLKELYAFGDFKAVYNGSLFAVIQKIKDDMKKIDIVLEKSFVAAKLKVDNHSLHKKEDKITGTNSQKITYKRLIVEQEDRLQKLVGHRWMESIFLDFNNIQAVEKPTGYLKNFKKNNATKAYEIYNKTEEVKQMEDYLEAKIIDFYFKKSVNAVNPDTFELRYINKN